MIIETYNKTKKDFEYTFNKAVHTKQVNVQIGDTILSITEHQLGEALDKPHIDVSYKGVVYSMDLDTFIRTAVQPVDQLHDGYKAEQILFDEFVTKNPFIMTTREQYMDKFLETMPQLKSYQKKMLKMFLINRSTPSSHIEIMDKFKREELLKELKEDK